MPRQQPSIQFPSASIPQSRLPYPLAHGILGREAAFAYSICENGSGKVRSKRQGVHRMRRIPSQARAIETLIAQDLSDEIARPAQAAAELIAAQGLPGPSVPTRPMSEPALFVLTRAVSGVINAAVREGSPHFGTQQFEDELVHLVRGF